MSDITCVLKSQWICIRHVDSHATPRPKTFLMEDPNSIVNKWNVLGTKRVHSSRTGVSYDVTIRKYNQLPKDIQHRVNGQYFKLYKNLKFDVHCTNKQITRWNHITTKRIYKRLDQLYSKINI